jgi:outer membrane protein OmpA-like peptidoglycan-associated protein
MKGVILFLLCGLAFTLASCAEKRTLIVLLPDSEGKTGSIVVSNKGGSQLLTEPYQATTLRSFDTSPAASFVMDRARVDAEFDETLSVLPEPPLRFMLFFRTGTTIFTEESKQLLARMLTTAAFQNTIEVSIVGHADRVDSRKKNARLSLKRASRVKKVLVAIGIDPDIITVVASGEDSPLIPTADEIDEPRNRRVEVIVR